MDTQAALAFLEAHQPMPDDADLDEALIGKYDDVRRHFLENPDERCIPLFLNSFGSGDGFGVYQLIEDVLAQFPPEKVVPHLAAALQSSRQSVRYWSAQIAEFFPEEELVSPLGRLLKDEEFDVRYAAVTALGQISSVASNMLLSEHRQQEADAEISDLIEEILSENANDE
jgi:HEAT repeat protein